MLHNPDNCDHIWDTTLDVPCLPRLEKTFPGGTHEKRSQSEQQGSEGAGNGLRAESPGEQPAALEKTCSMSELLKL